MNISSSSGMNSPSNQNENRVGRSSNTSGADHTNHPDNDVNTNAASHANYTRGNNRRGTSTPTGNNMNGRYRNYPYVSKPRSQRSQGHNDEQYQHEWDAHTTGTTPLIRQILTLPIRLVATVLLVIRILLRTQTMML